MTQLFRRLRNEELPLECPEKVGGRTSNIHFKILIIGKPHKTTWKRQLLNSPRRKKEQDKSQRSLKDSSCVTIKRAKTSQGLRTVCFHGYTHEMMHMSKKWILYNKRTNLSEIEKENSYFPPS